MDSGPRCHHSGAVSLPQAFNGTKCFNLRRSNQHRATIMIATTMNVAISESARSSDFERGLVASGIMSLDHFGSNHASVTVLSMMCR
jgi:hypothetical protein